MDANGSLGSCSGSVKEEASFRNACHGSYWTWEEDKALENALAVYREDANPWGKVAAAVPGKTIEDVKLHYKALRYDPEAIESDKVPLPHYPSNKRICKKKKKPLRIGAKPGKHGKDEEHSGSYWTKEEDKAFENALVLYHDDPYLWNKIALVVPGKSIEELKLHYEALTDSVQGVEFGKAPLLHYLNKDRACKKKGKSLRIGTKQASRWTDEEHGSFLLGLEKYGRGDWKNISQYFVLTKSNTQVASHAQKYFRALSMGLKNRKRSSINYKRPVSMSSSKKLSGTTMLGCPTQATTSVREQPQLLASFGIIPDLLFSTQPAFEFGSPAAGMPGCIMFNSQPIQEVSMSTYLPPFTFKQKDGTFLRRALFDFNLEAGIPAHSMFAPDLIREPIQELGCFVAMRSYVPPVPSTPPPGSFNIPSTSDAMDLDMDIFADLPDLMDID